MIREHPIEHNTWLSGFNCFYNKAVKRAVRDKAENYSFQFIKKANALGTLKFDSLQCHSYTVYFCLSTFVQDVIFDNCVAGTMSYITAF